MGGKFRMRSRASAFGLLAMLTLLLAPSVAAKVEGTDNWGHYFASISGHTASIVFDDGLSKRIDRAGLPNALRIEITLKDTRPDGLPTSDEGGRLEVVDEEIYLAVIRHGGLYLGRITTNGTRWVMALIPAKYDGLEKAIENIADQAHYDVDIQVKPDPRKRIYWDDLYPTDDDRQVMEDMSVLAALTDAGDRSDAERPVDHWTYFSSKADAEAFAKWLSAEGYQNARVERSKGSLSSNRRWLVRSQHVGTMQVGDITHHTLKHARKAREMDGEYDGWETQVTKAK